MAQAKASVFQFLSISRDSLPSVQYIESDMRWQMLTIADLDYDSEKQLLGNIKSLIGDQHFTSDKLLLLDAENLNVYGGRLEAFTDETGTRSLCVKFGENQIPLTFSDNQLKVGDCPAKTSVIPGKRMVDGEAVDVRLLNLDLSRSVEGTIYKLVVSVNISLATDPDYVQALLDNGDFDACVELDDDGVSLIQESKQGTGGLYPSLGDLSKTLKASQIKIFPKAILGVIGYTFHEVSGTDSEGKPYNIKSAKVAINPDQMPAEMLISWGSGKNKAQFRLEGAKGFEISSKGKYDEPIYTGIKLIDDLMNDRPVPPEKVEYANTLLNAYKEGKLAIVLRDWHPTHPASSPVSLLHPNCPTPRANWSAINIASVTMLPGKGQSTASTEFSAPQLPPASEPEALPVDFEPVTVEAVAEKVKTRKASPV